VQEGAGRMEGLGEVRKGKEGKGKVCRDRGFVYAGIEKVGEIEGLYGGSRREGGGVLL